MPNRWVILTCMLFLGSAGTSEATPLDSPDIVYIDGLPCNSLCRSYMAWSREMSSILAQRPRKAVARRVTGIRGERSKPAGHARIAKQAVPNSNEMPRAKIVDLQRAGNAATNSGTTGANIAGSPPKGGSAAGSNTRTIQEQVTAAMAVAEQVTAATAVPGPEQKANNTDRSDHSETVLRGDAENTAPALPSDTDHLVAILMARPEIKSVSDLTSKIIAIDDRQSASNGSVRTAIAAAGATEVQLSDGQTKAIDRLISGEVLAAVLTLVSPEAAEWFPEIAGFKIFRIPLSPRSLKARLDTTP
jgi:hypothetical protein